MPLLTFITAAKILLRYRFLLFASAENTFHGEAQVVIILAQEVIGDLYYFLIQSWCI